MSDRSWKARRLPWVLGVAVVAGVILAVWLVSRPARRTASEQAFPLPPYSATPFLNTGPETQYVGTDACTECHRGKHESYLLTAHSRAFADLDPKAEPPDGSFQHQASGRSYRVYRQNNQLRHEEVLRTAEGKEIARMDLPVRYLIGSGHFCRSYLVEVEGFLHESPITWYVSKDRWDMSPGYDFPQHWTFERPVKAGCLSCHVGRVEPIGGAVHRLSLQEKAIGCESCHGPGSRHAELHRANKLSPGEGDLTIVNPGKLSRSRLEAICAVCHLNGPAKVLVRGRQLNSFRPGMALTDYRIDYRFEGASEPMTVVGHIDQLRQSACYQKSNDMTCLTCHDPHARQKPKDTTAFYRQKCLSCHTTQSCRLGPAERLQKDATDNCVACHMPRGNTDIPHISFTHHRIGKHPQPPALPSEEAPRLVPTDDVSALPPIDRDRNLGLAYLETASDNPQSAKYAEVFRLRARDLLESVHKAGLRDGVTAQALAKIYLPTDPGRAGDLAREALAAKDLPPEARALALIVLANCEVQDGNLASAIGHLEELVRLRRFADDWRFLGMCYLAQNEPRKALAALQQALAIRPYRPNIHAGLAEVYRRLGDPQHAADHLEKAEWLTQHRQE